MDPAALGALVDRYGLPLAILGGFAWALFTRRLILGSEKERSDVAYQSELAYREARRLEEREGRLAVEAALRDLSSAVAKLSDSVEQHNETVIAFMETIRARQ